MSNPTPDDEFGQDDVPESDTGLLMSQSENLKASVSLDAVTNLEATLEEMDRGTLPPHVHPSIPREMLHPELTQTAPPLKLWPLAVLVFYSECCLFVSCILLLMQSTNSPYPLFIKT